MGAEQGDDGSADPSLTSALEAWAAHPSAACGSRVHSALLTARLLVPLVPVPDDEGSGTSMARPSLLGADGRPATLAFTSLATLTAWNAAARPVPVEAARLLAEAAASGDAVVLDLAGPVTYVLEGDLLDSLATGYIPVETADDVTPRAVEGGLTSIGEPEGATPGLRETLADALGDEPLVAEAYLLAPAEGPDASDVAVGLVLRDEASPAELVAIVRRLADRLGPSPTVRRGLDIAVLTADQRGAALRLGPPAYVGRTTV